MMKRNKLLSKTKFYYYNLLAFITNGNKRFVDKKLIFGALLIGLSSQYGCKTNDQNDKTLQENKEKIGIDKNLKNKLRIKTTDSLNTDLYWSKNKITTVAVTSCYLTSNKNNEKPDSNIRIIKKDNQIIDEPTCYVAFEPMPEFPGGKEKRIQFIKDNIIYPQIAKDNNIQGTVYLTFLIEKDGKLDNIKVLRGISKECDEEAIRIVKLMPKWKFLQQNKNPEAVQFNMPIKFTLDTLKK